MKSFVTFRTRLFNHSEIHDNFVNSCCFGEDVVVWLRDRLADSPLQVGEPIAEDYGWGLWVAVGSDRVWVATNTFTPESADAVAAWGIAIADDAGTSVVSRLFRKRDSTALALVCKKIDAVLYTEGEIADIEWWRNDFHSGISSNHPILE